MTQQSTSETPAAPKGRTETTRIAFVCVQNAGRSQMAYAFGQREIENRGLDGEVEVITGGTRPAEHVHDEVVRAMDAIDLDVAGRTPREITFEETQGSDYVITMGCSADDVCPAGWAGENRDWDLDDPDGRPAEEVAAIRDEIEARVSELFDEIQKRV
ncbi:low molecular weight phosphatase family protein [Halobellus sp. Atlit-38R]|uniref:arsenate-mycothiol transferase ArsC n=1 Tax=Halobellus sp. Atlit-38R TaxID=2282131 RepID=UPI000EF209A7|nr:low molecular weight phosphatase family protein [Halobellus sp. Atlit-38R]RLM89364.1 low molecular weight phosphatase family protein [Halobellus sp. Atlit-38R]